jgi:hypothetical protein
MGTLDRSACKEWFSVAYVEALAYAAGYAVIVNHVDHFGVDLEVKDRSVRIDVQMKCTERFDSRKQYVSFSLDKRTYDLLSDPARTVPAYLFLLEVPSNIQEWVHNHHEGIRLLKCAYYREMTGLPPTSNSTSQVVRLDKCDRLSVSSLEEIMQKARRGR